MKQEDKIKCIINICESCSVLIEFINPVIENDCSYCPACHSKNIEEQIYRNHFKKYPEDLKEISEFKTAWEILNEVKNEKS